MLDNKNNHLALALVGDPEKLDPKYSKGFHDGFREGVHAALEVMFKQVADKRKPGRRKKSAADRKWPDARLIGLLADIAELKARGGHSDSAACGILASKAVYRARYGGMPASTLRRRLADARKTLQSSAV